jgi:hypothetical protein
LPSGPLVAAGREAALARIGALAGEAWTPDEKVEQMRDLDLEDSQLEI